MIKRTLFQDIKGHLGKKEVSFIIGPRQAGKTTLMLLLKKHLEDKGERAVYLNLDIEADKQFFASQSNLLKKIELEIGKRGVVFIDEIQRKEDAGIFLKGIYDMNLPYKFIVSGSGSVELKEKIHESLIGRKRAFELSTLSFDEFADVKTGYRYTSRLSEFLSLDKENAGGLLEEYLNFGGYPRVVLEEKLEEKRRTIDEIYQSYLEKDIAYLLKVRKTEDFGRLLRLLSSQTGGLINISELSSTLGISQKTVRDYLWYLQKTFILKRITPYFKNLRKEISKAPVPYFYDLGLRNYAAGSFGNLRGLKDTGFVFQNLAFNIIRDALKVSPAEIHFWRTKDGAEVDFVIDYGRGVVPVEVKYKRLKGPKLTRSLVSFLERYRPKKALFVNISLDEVVSAGKTEVHFLPFYRIRKALKKIVG